MVDVWASKSKRARLRLSSLFNEGLFREQPTGDQALFDPLEWHPVLEPFHRLGSLGKGAWLDDEVVIVLLKVLFAGIREGCYRLDDQGAHTEDDARDLDLGLDFASIVDRAL